MTQTLVKNIDAVPALPESVQAVERVYQNSESTFEDFTKIIEKDPLLSANILKVVNSPLFGLPRKIVSISQAVSLLGKDAVRACALGSVVDSFEIDLSPYNMTSQDFQKACELQLSLALNWAGKIDREITPVLAPAAFLVDIGRVVIAKTLIEDDKADVIEVALLSGEDISQAEITACGAQTTDVTATLFAKWNFDPDTIHIIRYADDPEGANPDEQKAAAYLKAIREAVMPNGDITEDSINQALETIEEFGLDEAKFKETIEKITKED